MNIWVFFVTVLQTINYLRLKVNSTLKLKLYIVDYFSFQNKQEFCKVDLRKALNISMILNIHLIMI